jgi:hypothetical protein
MSDKPDLASDLMHDVAGTIHEDDPTADAVAAERGSGEHVQGKLPDNVAFEGYQFHRIDDVVGTLEDAGVGFGKATKKGGPVYHYHGIGNNSRGLVISNHKPS